jgi:hypothetical protein
MFRIWGKHYWKHVKFLSPCTDANLGRCQALPQAGMNPRRWLSQMFQSPTITLISRPDATGALLVMAHPDRSAKGAAAHEIGNRFLHFSEF